MSIFLYSIVSYLIGVSALVYMLLWMADVIPGAFGGPLPDVAVFAWVWNVLLLLLFGLQHTVMARQSFKHKLIRLLPASAERSTYVLATGIVMLTMVAFWSPMSTVVWQVNTAWLNIWLWGIFIFGWSLCLYATFAINHFDLMGLRQGYYAFRQRDYQPIEFKQSGLYRYIRHPIQTGVLIGIWITPQMTLEHLAMSIGISLYIFVGLHYEERDLIKHFGDEYRNYKKQTGGLLPTLTSTENE